LYAQREPVFEHTRLARGAFEQSNMSDLTALERRKYANAAKIFADRHKEAEERQELNLEF
jgi:hypothetical protein